MILRGSLPPSLARTLATIHAAAFAAGGRPWSADEIAALGETPTGLLALDNPAAPGGFALLRVVADEAEVMSVAVTPQAWGRGIGRRLLGAVLEAARDAGARQAFLEVGAGNARAQSLYARAGFTVIGRRRGYYAGPPPEDALLMSRPLADAP